MLYFKNEKCFSILAYKQYTDWRKSQKKKKKKRFSVFWVHLLFITTAPHVITSQLKIIQKKLIWIGKYPKLII